LHWQLTIFRNKQYNARVQTNGGTLLATQIDIALIIVSIALIASVIFQNKGVGLGGLTGADSSQVFSARRGLEKTIFYITIGLAVVFVLLTLAAVAFG
jgi:preprotein translocase subunit SecG